MRRYEMRNDCLKLQRQHTAFEMNIKRGLAMQQTTSGVSNLQVSVPVHPSVHSYSGYPVSLGFDPFYDYVCKVQKVSNFAVVFENDLIARLKNKTAPYNIRIYFKHTLGLLGDDDLKHMFRLLCQHLAPRQIGNISFRIDSGVRGDNKVPKAEQDCFFNLPSFLNSLTALIESGYKIPYVTLNGMNFRQSFVSHEKYAEFQKALFEFRAALMHQRYPICVDLEGCLFGYTPYAAQGALQCYHLSLSPYVLKQVLSFKTMIDRDDAGGVALYQAQQRLAMATLAAPHFILGCSSGAPLGYLITDIVEKIAPQVVDIPQQGWNVKVPHEYKKTAALYLPEIGKVSLEYSNVTPEQCKRIEEERCEVIAQVEAEEIAAAVIQACVRDYLRRKTAAAAVIQACVRDYLRRKTAAISRMRSLKRAQITLENLLCIISLVGTSGCILLLSSGSTLTAAGHAFLAASTMTHVVLVSTVMLMLLNMLYERVVVQRSPLGRLFRGLSLTGALVVGGSALCVMVVSAITHLPIPAGIIEITAHTAFLKGIILGGVVGMGLSIVLSARLYRKGQAFLCDRSTETVDGPSPIKSARSSSNCFSGCFARLRCCGASSQQNSMQDDAALGHAP
jgi:hypothetical protein